MGWPPVAMTRSHWRISSLVISTVGFSMQMIRSSGAPYFFRIARISAQARVLVFLLRGWGAKMMASRAFMAFTDWIMGCISGWVLGTRDPMTPTGLEIRTSPFSGISSVMPTDLTPFTS